MGGSEFSEHKKRQVLQTNDMHTIGNWLNFTGLESFNSLVTDPIYNLMKISQTKVHELSHPDYLRQR